MRLGKISHFVKSFVTNTRVQIIIRVNLSAFQSKCQILETMLFLNKNLCKFLTV